MTSEIENKKKIKEFFSKEYASMRSYIRSRISDATDRTADDILQDVALKMFSRTDYSSPINDVAAYVYHTIKNKIIDIFRSKKQLKVYESEQTMKFEAVVNDFAEIFYGKSDNDYSEKMKHELFKAIGELKEDYRNIIIAINFEGYSYRELSEETGVPTGTLLSRHHRALSVLIKKFKNR
jgi:RNA polymerase sigma factor (sigma-70 family)